MCGIALNVAVGTRQLAISSLARLLPAMVRDDDDDGGGVVVAAALAAAMVVSV